MRYLLALLLLVSPCYADVRIAKCNRVPNRGPMCMWASLETIGKHTKNQKLSGLVDWYSQYKDYPGASEFDVRLCLDGREVNYQIYHDMTLADLKAKTDAGIPVVISIPGHAIVAVHVEGKWIKTVDSNWPDVYSWYTANIWEHWGVEIQP